MAVAEPAPHVAVPPANGPGPQSPREPRITANRRRLDNRFPSLGFTVDTGGRPFFEVLLATDATLFDPANAARRTHANFYSSRHDSGLIPASEATHPYLVPSAVLRGFGGAPSRSRAIYYTLIAYEGSDGRGPAFAHSPSSLATNAPSVVMAADFTGNTLASVLSVSVHKLQRLGGSATAPDASAVDGDAAEGEDGYGWAPSTDTAPALATPASGQPVPASGSPVRHANPSSEPMGEDYQLAVLSAPRPPLGAQRSATRRDPLLPRQSAAQATALGAEYGVEQTDVPDYLADDEDDQDYTARSTATDVAMRTDGYHDEAEEVDRPPADYGSLDGSAPATVEARTLAVEDKMRIIDRVAPFESGGDYGAINPDGEFAGRFGAGHPAYQRYHVGLSYGLIQFTQDSGKLGQLLSMMRDRDPDVFTRTFGSDADELIRVTNASGPPSSQSPGGRSARVQPVAGADLWEEPWVSRFRAAASNERFKAAQRELAARGYLDPMLEFAGWLGLNTEKALTIVVDRSIQMGVAGAKRWIISSIGLLDAEAARRQGLSALGFSDLGSFQASVPGLAADGEWGPNTHAALVGALRKLGSGAPVPIPTSDQMVEAMVRRAAREPWHSRIEQLAGSGIPDTRFQL